MNNFYQFASDSPWLTFFLAWLITHFVFVVINRFLRTIKVLAAGWPPEHLDADGDWKSEEEK